MRLLGFALVSLFLALMVYATGGLPDRGNPEAPGHENVWHYYLEKSMEETATPNVVTAVLADYRSFDTFGETIVIFTAGLACIVILMKRLK